MAKLFNQSALLKCFDRLDKAKRELQLCRSAGNFENFASHWAEFLIHTGSVLNQLEAGAKQTPQARQWYGQQRAAGKRDPLVSYMHQARNAEEHEPDATTKHKPPSLSINLRDNPGGFKIDRMIAERDGDQFQISGSARRLSDNGPLTIRHSVGGPILVPVTDQYKATTYHPPEEHLGKPLRDKTPIAIADLYLTYLEGLVRQAAALP